jgi:hypothetical protein
MVGASSLHRWRHAKRLMHRPKLEYMEYRLAMAAWFSHFFEKAFVRGVNRRIDIRIVRFWRST